MKLKIKCTNTQNNTKTIFYFYPKLEILTLCDLNILKIKSGKFIKYYNKFINDKNTTNKFIISDEFNNKYIFEIIEGDD